MHEWLLVIVEANEVVTRCVVHHPAYLVVDAATWKKRREVICVRATQETATNENPNTKHNNRKLVL